MATFGGQTVTGVFKYSGNNTNASIHTVTSGSYAKIIVRSLIAIDPNQMTLSVGGDSFAQATGGGGNNGVLFVSEATTTATTGERNHHGGECWAVSGETIAASGIGSWSFVVLEFNNP